METPDPVLLHDWHPACYSKDLNAETALPLELLGQELVLWRDSEKVHAWRDLCLHRGTKLSLGKVSRCRLVCAYHGWEYDSEGRCVKIPAHPNRCRRTKPG